MSVFTFLYSTIVEALFPLSPQERELLSYTPEQALTLLPSAPQVPIENSSSIFAYKDERVAKLVWNIKYKKSAVAISIGGYALYQKLHEMSLPQNTIIIPVPITKRRRRERGFNQCELLVDEIRRLDVGRKFEIRKDLLIRTQHADRQTLKGRSDRLESAKGVFAINQEIVNSLINRTIVVIDDVITTGSTMKEAVETLKKAGLRKAIGLSLAH